PRHRLGDRPGGCYPVRQGPRGTPVPQFRHTLPLRGLTMKLLVTGGAGFIGSAVVRAAVRAGHAVVNLDKLTYAGSLSNVAEVAESPLYAFEHADICDRKAIDRILAAHRPDAIMHLAAESHVDRSIDRPAAFIETTITGTYTMLEAARAYWRSEEHTS